MAAPDFLNSVLVPFLYLQTVGMTDVATIITDLRTQLVTNLGWTEPSTALFKSVPDSSGKFLDILVTRISATNLEFRVRDFRGSTLFTRRIQIDATASVNYFLNTRGACVESLRATAEIMWTGLLDPSPSSLSDIDNRIYGSAYRSAADGIDGQGGSVGAHFCFDNGVASIGSRIWSWGNNFNGNVVPFTMGSGSLTYRDNFMWITSATRRYAGRSYHTLLCDSGIAFGSDKIVPLDDAGNTGTFRVIGLALTSSMRAAMRKA